MIKLLFITNILIFTIPLSSQQLKKFYMEDDCGGGNNIYMERDGLFSGQLRPSRWARYRANMKCTITINAPPGQQLMIVFRKLDIEFEPSCDDDYLKLFDGNSISSYPLLGLPMRVCGSRKPFGSFSTTGSSLTVFFKSDTWSNEDGFDIVFTSFHKGSCREGEFMCRNGRCIDKSLECDGINNCGDKSDECHLSTEAFLGIAFGVAIVTIVAIATVTYIRRKSKANRRAHLKGKQQLFDVHNQVRILSENPRSAYPDDGYYIRPQHTAYPEDRYHKSQHNINQSKSGFQSET